MVIEKANLTSSQIPGATFQSGVGAGRIWIPGTSQRTLPAGTGFDNKAQGQNAKNFKKEKKHFGAQYFLYPKCSEKQKEKKKNFCGKGASQCLKGLQGSWRGTLGLN